MARSSVEFVGVGSALLLGAVSLALVLSDAVKAGPGGRAPHYAGCAGDDVLSGVS